MGSAQTIVSAELAHIGGRKTSSQFTVASFKRLNSHCVLTF